MTTGRELISAGSMTIDSRYYTVHRDNILPHLFHKLNIVRDHVPRQALLFGHKIDNADDFFFVKKTPFLPLMLDQFSSVSSA